MHVDAVWNLPSDALVGLASCHGTMMWLARGFTVVASGVALRRGILAWLRRRGFFDVVFLTWRLISTVMLPALLVRIGFDKGIWLRHSRNGLADRFGLANVGCSVLLLDGWFFSA
ncbi:hypothetical protein Nepgr_016449 [Nepenthes gracilis]|uniref:Uncharacterized protein n=1 Tax=Nepenthes gracilis TaxID=150966 RepID=A0AAD3XRM2_NEPGR|nr:hypothetical protein Nepgr_016449 [Nepenthes gracilis]